MSKLIQKLQQLKNGVDLNERYVWNIPSDCPIEIPTKFQSAYQKNVFLKENLSEKIDEKTYYWIIKKWGGIKSFKETNKNTQKINEFLHHCNNQRQLTKNYFGTISSLSKVSSFNDPLKLFIYDSRVIYSINWLNLVYGDSEKNWFPQPNGQNGEINSYNIDTIRLLTDSCVNIVSYKTAYWDYCKFISETAVKLGYRNPWDLEMLLFVIADSEIISDIKSHTSISIQNSVNWLIKNCSRVSIEDTPEGLNVDGDVNLSNMGLTEIPYKFHQVSGHFDISGNCLTSFKNCPKEAGSFDCSDNPYLSDDGKGLPDNLKGTGGNLFMARNNRSLAASLKENLGILVEKTSFEGVDENDWTQKLQDHFKFKPLREKLPELKGIF